MLPQKPLLFDCLVEATRQAVHVGPLTRILVAEDHKINQSVFKALLGLFGGKPLIVDNGAEAVVAWEMCEWDIILMDVQMPQMDGISAAAMIRAKELETRRPRTPIVAVTANTSQDDLILYRETGMDEVVAKPIEFSNLVLAMDRAMSARPANDGQARPLPIRMESYAATDAATLAIYIAGEMSRLRLAGFLGR